MMNNAPGLDRRTILAIGLTTLVGLALNVILVPRLMRMPSARGWDVAVLVAGIACAAAILKTRLIPLLRDGNRLQALPWIYGMTASLMFASLGLATAAIRFLS